jgi:RNA methyltransferase, TrmH family
MATPGKVARRAADAGAAPAGGAALLTSRDNRWLKEFRMTLRGGLPTEAGFVGVEGVRLTEEALQSGCPIAAVLFSETGERHRERLARLLNREQIAFPVLRTTDRLFEGLADTEHPQGVAALVKPRVATLDDLLSATTVASAEACSPLLVVLAGVQDPGNVGTILRTAAAFGATGAITAASGHAGTASPFSPKALRASAGAALHLPILAGMPLGILITQLKLANVHTLASSVHDGPPVGARHAVPALSERSEHESIATGFSLSPGTADAFRTAVHSDTTPLLPWQVDWCQPIALLVGNEGAGLPEEVERSADARIRIPMASGIESLNAAAAAAVLFYEAARQRAAIQSQRTRP